MRKGDIQTILFAAGVCLACSLLLSGTAALLQGRQQRAADLDRNLNILKVFGVEPRNAQGKRLAASEVDAIFKNHIRTIFIDTQTGEETDAPAAAVEGGPIRPLYLWREDGSVTRYAFPISGKGLWSTIYGYMALEADLSTIAAVTFYKDGETPGLGGEISKPWFEDQFKGKKIALDGRLQRIEVAKGKAPADSPTQVDGITGATLTGRGLTQFINADLEAYNAYFEKLRQSRKKTSVVGGGQTE